MVTAVIGVLAMTKIRRLVQIFPSDWMKLWDEWEIRVVILYSLLLQILLMAMGNRRKYTSQMWARFVIWAAYLSADKTATFALGLLSDSSGDSTDGSADSHKKVMTAFWAPFFLLHLGGPDTITAYALEDNELWLRNFLDVFSAFMLAFYVFLKLWSGTLLDYAGIPIFVAGLTKCVERTLALRFASGSYFTESMFQSNPGPPEVISYNQEIEYMIPYTPERETESDTDISDAGETLPTKMPLGNEGGSSTGLNKDTQDSDPGILHYSYGRLMVFVALFADLSISTLETISTLDFLKVTSANKAFELIDIELGLLYDLWYTKAKLTYSRIGCLLRFLSLSSSVVAFVVFMIVDKHQYSQVELGITWLLLIGAISLEFYAVTISVSSDWFMLWLVDPSSKGISRKIKDQLQKPVNMIARFLQLLHIIPPGKKRWSGTMGQYKLTVVSRQSRPSKCTSFLKLVGIYEFLEKQRTTRIVNVPKELYELIFGRLQEQAAHHRILSVDLFGKLTLDDVTKEFRCSNFFEIMECDFGDIPLYECILIWHIATNICYDEEPAHEVEILRDCSKWLSDYMLHLLINNPSMLTKGIEQLHFQRTLSVVNEIIERGCGLNETRSNERPDWMTSPVLSTADTLARALPDLAMKMQWDTTRKWKFISYIWMKIICHAATRCSSSEHAQQLRRGGELLTHVWFLMGHMGFIPKFF